MYTKVSVFGLTNVNVDVLVTEHIGIDMTAEAKSSEVEKVRGSQSSLTRAQPGFNLRERLLPFR